MVDYLYDNFRRRVMALGKSYKMPKIPYASQDNVKRLACFKRRLQALLPSQIIF